MKEYSSAVIASNFYPFDDKPSEGFVDDSCSGSIKALIIMKEPDSGGKPASSFWFRDIAFEKDFKYAQKLGKAVYLAMTGTEDDKKPENWKEALRHTIYINLYPEKGEKKESEEYKETLKSFSKKDCYHRKDIIDHLPEDCIIITVSDIYKCLEEEYGKKQETDENGFTIRGRIYKKFTFKDRNITVYEIRHPSAYGRNAYSICDLKYFGHE